MDSLIESIKKPRMALFFIVAVLFGAILGLIGYSFWKEKHSEHLTSINPGYIKNLGGLLKLLMHAASNDGHSICYHFTQLVKELNEQYQQQQMFYIWRFFNPQIMFVKAEAVKEAEKSSNDALRRKEGSILLFVSKMLYINIPAPPDGVREDEFPHKFSVFPGNTHLRQSSII
ncbi:hypothetical protein NPIL_428871 [Nephila pilipes]|uniref:Uncharacterized protein n=1 Tax=Nephila pilipes TaxID=299642 RepID=A0A8X6NIN3_NEPPI|nr:hypothetical protein NPIL_428871 [Nephila pilipes]